MKESAETVPSLLQQTKKSSKSSCKVKNIIYLFILII